MQKEGREHQREIKEKTLGEKKKKKLDSSSFCRQRGARKDRF